MFSVAGLSCYWLYLKGLYLVLCFLTSILISCSKEHTNISNYADDTNFYACNIDLNTLIINLEHDSLIAMEWFE